MGESPLEGLIVGVDLDGVCADFYGRMREIAAEWFEKRLAWISTEESFPNSRRSKGRSGGQA